MRLTFILLLLCAVSASAQTNLLMTESFCDWNGASFDKLPNKEIKYVYDANDELIQEIEFENMDTISGLDTSKITTYYPGTELVKSLIIKGGDENRDMLKEYEYVNGSCLLSEKKSSYIESEQRWFNFYTYYYDPITCQISSAINYHFNGEDSTNYVYEYENDSLKIYSYFNSSNDPFLYSYEVYGTSNELLLRIFITDLIDKYEYLYNDYGDIEKMTYSAAFLGDSIFRVFTEEIYDYDYGPTGEKYRETRSETWYPSSGSIDTWTYTRYFEFPMEENFYCDGLVKSTQYQINIGGVYENSTLKKYAYTFGENCSEPEMTASVFPNPNKGVFHIQSEMLEKSEVSVDIISLTGKSLFSIQIPERISTMEVDLSFLPRGIYILYLTSNDTSISKKIHIID